MYVVVLALPVSLEAVPKLRASTALQISGAAVMLGCLPLTYGIARSAGITTAGINQSDATELPFVQFATKCGTFSGRLLYLKDRFFYIQDVQADGKSKANEVCLTTSTTKTGTHFLTIYRAEDVHALEITERRSTGG